MSDAASGTTKIWYQSFVDPEDQAPYIQRLQSTLDEIASPGIAFEVHGLTPPDRYFHPLTEFRCAGQCIRNALAAERAGYSAFVIGHFQEPGLVEARGAVDIPVIALGESVLLNACSLGQKIGLVTIDPIFIPWHEQQVARHRLDQRVVGIRAIHANLSSFMHAFTDDEAYRAARAEFVEQVRPLVAAGAEVIIPAGGLPMLLFSREHGFTVDGAPVVSGIPQVAKAAEMALALQRLTGIVASRRGAYAKAPPQCIDEFLGRGW
jgi:Asp/Glu/hydantoin racemase